MRRLALQCLSIRGDLQCDNRWRQPADAAGSGLTPQPTDHSAAAETARPWSSRCRKPYLHLHRQRDSVLTRLRQYNRIELQKRAAGGELWPSSHQPTLLKAFNSFQLLKLLLDIEKITWGRGKGVDTKARVSARLMSKLSSAASIL